MKSLLFFLCLGLLARSSIQKYLVVSRVARQADQQPDTAPAEKLPEPKIYSMHVESRIAHRYAKTRVVSRIANPATKAQEVFFSMVLPETAFIAGFNLEVDGKVYEAYVKEKEEAKQEYNQAVAGGQTAALVGVSARDSNTFTVSVNVEPQHKITFNLTYEELLTRRLGDYSQVINLNPGQLIKDLQVDVYIKESRNITSLKVPEFRSGNEIDAEEVGKSNSLATIEKPSATEAHIHFAPSIEQQKEIAAKKKDKDENQDNKEKDKGLGGQFVVQYDVDREPQGGEVLVNEGYFVHFFAPSELKPLRKHVIFVLDVSGSMAGRKVEQLKEAMMIILDDLNPGDYMNLLEFSSSVMLWNLDSPISSLVYSPYNPEQTELGTVPAFPATPEYIKKAKDIVSNMTANGGTNIHDSLKSAIKVARTGLENVTFTDSKPEPIIVFLTDGEATVGETRPEKLQAIVSELNENPSAAIFSLAFGDDADFELLKKLSLRNSGFARKIYEAADATLQLRDFYKQVASPLLSNVTFKYDPEKVETTSVTRHNFPIFFLGSEIVVAGKLADKQTSDLGAKVSGQAASGDSLFAAGMPLFVPDTDLYITSTRPVSSLEKLWAYLTIQQLLEDQEANQDSSASSTKTDAENKTEEVKKKALKLALEYSFVTKLTSLVVVKPNDTSSAGLETSKPIHTGGNYPPNYQLVGGIPFSINNRIPAPLSPMYPAPGRPGFASSSFGGFAAGPAGPAGPAGFPGPFSTMRPISTTFRPTSTESVQSTTYRENPQLLSLNDLEWLAEASNGTDNLSVPLENGTEIFKLGLDEANIAGDKCEFADAGTSPSSHCRHLPHCVLNKFVKSVQDYSRYFCRIGDYAGVCCPDELQENLSSTTIQPSFSSPSA